MHTDLRSSCQSTAGTGRGCYGYLGSGAGLPFLPPAHIAFSGTLHLVDLVPGIFLPVVLDVSGVQLFQLVPRPRGRVAQLREQREKGVTAVPAAQPGTPKSGCMILPEICTDNSGKIQKRR